MIVAGMWLHFFLTKTDCSYWITADRSVWITADRSVGYWDSLPDEKLINL